MTQPAPVLLIASMSLRTPHKRALVAGGTGRVGAAIVDAAARRRLGGRRGRAGRRRSADARRCACARHGARGELGGLDLVVHAAGDGFAPKPIDDVTEERLGRGARRHREGDVLPRAGRGAGAARVHGVLVIVEDVASYQAWPSFAAHCAAKAAQAMLTRVLARALAPEVRVCGIAPGSVAVEPGQEDGERPRHCSDGSDSRRTSRTRWSSWQALNSSRGRHSWSDGGRLLQIQRGRRAVEPGCGHCDPTPYDATRDQRRRVDPARGDRRPVGVRGSLPAAMRGRSSGSRLRRLGDRGRAEDAVQETFASIWRSAGSYRPERGPGAPWLYAVARNAIVDRARARTEIPADIPDEAASEPAPTTAPSRAGSPGACTARSKSCRSASAR